MNESALNKAISSHATVSADGLLRHVMPTALDALDVPLLPQWTSMATQWGVAKTKKMCVVMADGLGDELLRQRLGYAPYMRKFLDQSSLLHSDFPTTTATSLGSFGTGLPPGTHGMMGYLVRDPETDRLFNELAWHDSIDPEEWQPETTAFEQAVAHGVSTYQIGPPHFGGSGMTMAVFRGAEFVGSRDLRSSVDSAIAMLEKDQPSLVYLYWGNIDKVGHECGWESAQWSDEVMYFDRAMKDLGKRLPTDASVIITADHGMVDIPHHARVDIAEVPELRKGVRYVGGEPRAPMLYCERGQAHHVVARWRKVFGGTIDMWTREEAARIGFYGAVDDRVLGRIGDVIVSTPGQLSIHDSRSQGTSWHTMIGMHGALTPEETAVPLIVLNHQQR